MARSRLVQLVCGALVLASSNTLAWADSAEEREAEEYMQTWEERGREACKDNERGCAAAGHALDRAAAAYEKAGRLDKAMAVRKMILDPQWHLDYTDYGRAAAFSLARNHQAIVEYAEAAQVIETAVRRFAKSEEAPVALQEAITLRVGLGELNQAEEDLNLFSKNYGPNRAKEVPGMVAPIATAYWDHGRVKEARTFLEKWMSSVDRHGNVHHRVVAHALLGRIHAHENATAKATAEFEVVRNAWVRPDEAIQEIQKLGSTPKEQDRYLAQTLIAVGEALFFFAEQKRAEVGAIRFPEYAGSGDKDSVVRFVGTKVSEWFKKKNQAIDEAEREYQKILQIQPVPPPRWVIAAAGRVGFMWSSFVGDFRRAPTPKEWNSTALFPGSSMTGVEIKKLYFDHLSSLSEPLTERSRQAYQVCGDYSRKFQWFDDHSRACVAWLEKNDRKRWIPLDEIRPQPVHLVMPMVSAPIAAR
jgi:tetratricopeptide (TPR) repeat protein